jgi:hypothetical protein
LIPLRSTRISFFLSSLGEVTLLNYEGTNRASDIRIPFLVLIRNPVVYFEAWKRNEIRSNRSPVG